MRSYLYQKVIMILHNYGFIFKAPDLSMLLVFIDLCNLFEFIALLLYNCFYTFIKLPSNKWKWPVYFPPASTKTITMHVSNAHMCF